LLLPEPGSESQTGAASLRPYKIGVRISDVVYNPTQRSLPEAVKVHDMLHMLTAAARFRFRPAGRDETANIAGRSRLRTAVLRKRQLLDSGQDQLQQVVILVHRGKLRELAGDVFRGVKQNAVVGLDQHARIVKRVAGRDDAVV
jgi:hypothetical protein